MVRRNVHHRLDSPNIDIVAGYRCVCTSIIRGRAFRVLLGQFLKSLSSGVRSVMPECKSFRLPASVLVPSQGRGCLPHISNNTSGAARRRTRHQRARRDEAPSVSQGPAHAIQSRLITQKSVLRKSKCTAVQSLPQQSKDTLTSSSQVVRLNLTARSGRVPAGFGFGLDDSVR